MELCPVVNRLDEIYARAKQENPTAAPKLLACSAIAVDVMRAHGKALPAELGRPTLSIWCCVINQRDGDETLNDTRDLLDALQRLNPGIYDSAYNTWLDEKIGM